MSQKVLLKIKLGNDLRRITLDEKPNFDTLNGLMKTLFAEELKSDSFYIKYLDDENDLIRLTHDREISEAWEFALNSGSARPLLRLVIEKKSVESKPAAEKKDKKEKEKVEEDDQEDTSQPSLRNLLNLPEVQGILGALNIDPESVKPCINFLNPLFLGGFQQPQAQAQPQTQPCCSTSDKPVHNALCDSCDARIAGIRFKCTACPDYDLCEKCEPKSASIHPNHTFVKIFKPDQKFFGCGMNRPTFHRAFCDVCYHRIIGTRYKCANCDDYDLCERCYINCKTVHDATHTFNVVAAPTWGCKRPGAWVPGAWGHRRFGGWKNRCGDNKAESGTPESSSCGFGQSSTGCPMRNWQRRCQFGQNVGQTEKYMARYISDVTVEDGAKVVAGSEFVKIWKMKNIGNNAWPENTRLVFVCGDSLSKEEAVVIPAVAPGEEVCVSVDMKAPEKPGRYVSNYRLVTPEGVRFGHRVWVDVIVVPKVEEKKEVKEEVGKVEVKEEKEVGKVEVKEEKKEEVGKVEEKVEEKEEKKEEVVVKVSEEEKESEKVEVVGVKGLDEKDPLYGALKMLEDMGFNDHEINRSLLVIHKGNLSSVVSQLLG